MSNILTNVGSFHPSSLYSQYFIPSNYKWPLYLKFIDQKNNLRD